MVEKDIGVKSILKKYDGDPYLSFFEFQAVICKLGVDATPKEHVKKDNDLYDGICKFFTQNISIRHKSNENDWDFFKKANKNITSYLYRLFAPQKKHSELAAATTTTTMSEKNHFHVNDP